MNSLSLILRRICFKFNGILNDISNKLNIQEIPDYSFAVQTPNGLAQPPVPRNVSDILEDIIENGFMWAVPKKRRSLERRMTRRMGYGKLILPRKNIVVCQTCGHFHQVHAVCGNCYEKVKQETELMQEAVLKEWKLDPINKEVVIIYKNEGKDEKTFQGKQIIEIAKERPAWFSKNLLTKDSEIPREKFKAVKLSNVIPDKEKE